MTVRYAQRREELVPIYVCSRREIEKAEPACQSVPGASVDQAVGRVLLDAVKPMSLEVTLSVQKELEARLAEVGVLRDQQVERARYEADHARTRYMQVDPANRLVAASLEADWNEKLRTFHEAQERIEKERKQDQRRLTKEQIERVKALATDLPKLWIGSNTPVRERKRMIRLLIEDATILKEEELVVHVRYRGGATTSLRLPRPRSAPELRKNAPELDGPQQAPIRVSELLEECAWKHGGRREPIASRRIVARSRILETAP